MARPAGGKEADEMWTMQNTWGFQQAELDAINKVLERLMAGSDGLEESFLNEALNNEWREGISEAELYEAVTKRLGLAVDP